MLYKLRSRSNDECIHASIKTVAKQRICYYIYTHIQINVYTYIYVYIYLYMYLYI